MAYLFDTCALSEFIQKKPNQKVIDYLGSLPNQDTFISVTSSGEILFGIELLPSSTRRSRLMDGYSQWVLPSFHGRILANDLAMMQRWGPLMAGLQRRGFRMQYKDSLIAACALATDLTLITRNDSDFVHSGVRIINPWKIA